MTSPRERRIEAEWSGLCGLAERNRGRLCELVRDAVEVRLTLRDTPARSWPDPERLVTSHPLRILFPEFFPAVPMALYLDQPVLHPNVHPETGFVCLWATHRVGHTAEQALHKTVAMLGWQLFNREAVHIMQPRAWEQFDLLPRDLRDELVPSPLLSTGRWLDTGASPDAEWRRRLS